MKSFFNSLITFFKKETVLCIAAILAVISSFAVIPDKQYQSYPDWRVLSLLFCLMLVVAGLQSIGVFHHLAATLLSGIKNTRGLIITLVLLCFFSAMFITNDVALITFVPFSIMILSMAGAADLLIPAIVLETIAANLGSMLTPIGNPQNLYLYSKFNMDIGSFLLYMLPLALLSLILLVICGFMQKSISINTASLEKQPFTRKMHLIVYTLLFLVCIGCVIHIVAFPAMLAITVIAVFFMDKSLFKKVDYCLLLTFVCFFVFIGNMQRISAISQWLSSVISGRELMASVLSSQIISNVPAAMLLSGFTQQIRPLLYGVNIGGLGTLIASLASVISYKCYANTAHSKKGAYIKTFTAYNVVFLIVLCFAAYLLLSLPY